MSHSENPSGADNQQERAILSPDLLAGLIVGEGSYYIAIHRWKSGVIHLSPCFSIRMNDVETIDRVGESFDFYGLERYRNPAIYHRCHTISVNGSKRMRPHLDFFLPLLIGKKLEAAEVLSEFVDRRLANGNRRFTEEDIGAVERLREINGPSGTRVPIAILRDYMLSANGRELAKR